MSVGCVSASKSRLLFLIAAFVTVLMSVAYAATPAYQSDLNATSEWLTTQQLSDGAILFTSIDELTKAIEQDASWRTSRSSGRGVGTLDTG